MTTRLITLPATAKRITLRQMLDGVKYAKAEEPEEGGEPEGEAEDN